MMPASGRRADGFTLVEVLVAMLVTAVGLLGMAKMQALAISTTKNSGTRSLIALQTESLAAFMHANGTFWAKGFAPSTFTASGVTVVDAAHTVDGGTAGACTSACTPGQLAATDVQSWAEDMNNQFPTYTAKVDCTLTLPVNCTIYVTWQEKTIAANKNGVTGVAQVATQSFSVYVKP